MEVFIIPYTLLCYFAFMGIKLMAGGDEVIATYALSSAINVSFLITVAYVSVVQLAYGWYFTVFTFYATHMFSLLLGYYTFDTIRLLYGKDKDKVVYLIHHFLTLFVMFFHMIEVLPIHVGCGFLFLFELSNVVLIPYQLCLCKGWQAMRYKLSHLMVYTYVPTRLIAIPLCSLLYIPYMRQLSTCMWYLCASMICSLVMFSVYFAVYIGYRYCFWLLKKK
jgi:hypothetical protein